MRSASRTRYSTFVEAVGLAVAPRRLEHLRREVGADHAALVAHPLGGGEAEVARAGGDVEDRLPRLRVDLLDDPLVDRAR